MKTANQTHWLCILTATLLIGSGSSLAQDTNILTKSEQKARIAKVYATAKSAKTTQGYSKFIDDCDGLLELKLSEKNQRYVNSLKAWGLNRRGEARLETAEMLRGAGNLKDGDQALAKAVDDLTAATVANPKRSRAWLCLGFANMHQEKYDDAIANFGKTIELAPNEMKARFNRAEAYFCAEQFELAIKDYERVLEKDSGDLQALTGRGHCHFELANFEEASKDFDAVAQLSPNSSVALANRAETMERLGRWEQAYDDYTKSIELDPSERALSNLVTLLATCPEEKFNRPDEAISNCLEAMKTMGRTPTLLLALAEAQIAKGNPDEANRLRKQAKRLAEKSAQKPDGEARLTSFDEDEVAQPEFDQ